MDTLRRAAARVIGQPAHFPLPDCCSLVQFATPLRILSKPATDAAVAERNGIAASPASATTTSASSAGTAPQDGRAQQAQPSASPLSSASPSAASAAPAADRSAKPTASVHVPLMYNRPVQLLDARLKLVGVDALAPLLLDSAPSAVHPAATSHPCEFTVFGAVGSQHSGRSTILNALARLHSSRRPSPAQSSSAAPQEASFPGGDATRPEGFFATSTERMLKNLHQTAWIDVLVTPERNILIDTPPLDSAALLATMVSADYPLPSSTSLDQVFELHTLQTLLLLLECCHVLLVTCESHTVMHMSRLVQRALLVRQHLTLDTHLLATRASASSPSFHSLPDIVFVVNKLPMSQLAHPLAPSASHAQLLSNFFAAHAFRKNGWVSTFAPRSCDPRANATVNCFQLPWCDDTARGTAGAAAAGESQLSLALQELSHQLLTLPKHGVSHRTSERDWLRHVSRVWHDLQVTPALAEMRSLVEKVTPVPTALLLRAQPQPSERSGHAKHPSHKLAATGAAAAAVHGNAGPHWKQGRQQSGTAHHQSSQHQQFQQQSAPPPSSRRLYEPNS